MLGSAVHQPIIGIAAPGHAWKGSTHPDIKRIMQKQVCENGADHCALRCTLGAFHQCPVRKLQRRLQPALNVEPHPFLLRMFLDRPQQQLVVNVVKRDPNLMPPSTTQA